MELKRILFRYTQTNRYSITALVASIYSYKKSVKMYEIRNFDDIFSFSREGTVVLYSFMSFDLKNVISEVRILKENGYMVIAGGPHATANPTQLLDIGIDYVFTGDGEENIRRFLDGFFPKNRIFDGVKNRVDLSKYPPFCPQKNLYMPIEITRGCPFSCGYCQTPRLAGKIVRHRPVEQIVEYSKLGVKNGRKIARFISPNSFGYGSKNGITPNVEVVDDLLYNLKKIGVEEIYFGTFPSDVRPESVSREILKVIKKYVNNKYIVIGAQSGSEGVLKRIRRGHNLDEIERALALLKEFGFIPRVDFIFGFPFETEKDVEETFEFIKKIVKKYDAKVHAHTFMPLPGTPLANVGPGRLTKKHYKFLGLLTSQGYLDGYWLKQEELARRVANVNSSSPI
ncbi:MULTISPECIES: TIGR04013 family B12-binding domain/radical SAM domain-containing protein [unclassified Thermosipho (in: thermotogales)]|uniref:TIGR04013 family B12-binding domain/radical SAM domain-containing protein n=1 Tax=unclassified Thermosipho (in: thermotogales) TaxID=2676525 RepID=UPI0009841682|nr:TIGR04013 family B12-binding domain/radical SAM domain-containing protein [Thermosipho sp. 1223]MBT1248107.1 B12-binding domain/radical SAM domain-containing protein [Thermosipho sp. 1244]OOC46695.1 radical SAM protein [Thermosipho sp. 1223]